MDDQIEKKKSSGLKWYIVVFLVVVGLWGGNKHHGLKESVTETTVKLLNNADYKNLIVDGINLPVSLAFLNISVIADVFFKKNDGGIIVIKVNVTPKGGMPILSIFSDTAFYVNIEPTELMKLLALKLQ